MIPGFDPNTIDPAVISRLTVLMQKLSPDQINQMQTMMHNMMGGFDVNDQREKFENSLPEEFKRELQTIFAQEGYRQAGHDIEAISETVSEKEAQALPANEKEARLTILRALSNGAVSPEDAYEVLFP